MAERHPPEPNEPVLIIGCGAMACLFAARLSMAGSVIWMAGNWTAGLQALRADGVRLIDPQTGEQACPVKVIDPGVSLPPFRYALVLVKSWQTEDAAKKLKMWLAEEGIALTLQNGLGNLEVLAHWLGADRAALGVTTSGALLLKPGIVQLAGLGPIYLAEHPRLQGMVDIMRAGGFEVVVSQNAEPLIWGKLVINASINPLAALLRLTNGELLESAAARQLMRAAAREATAVAQALNIHLPYANAEEQVMNVAKATSQNRSSMLQDILRGAPTEIEAINGAIVRAAEAQNLAAPINQTLRLLVRALQTGE